ncbi:kinase-like domain-containing protein, partial [Baffinella frigidus]
MSRGGLNDVLLDASVELDPPRKRKMAFDAAKGIAYLHSLKPPAAKGIAYLHSLKPPVLHRDIKGANVLVDGNWGVKIADFGLSRFRVEYTMTFCGSPKWTAPEVLNGECYGTAADAWSFGVVLWEIVSRKVPYTEGTWSPARQEERTPLNKAERTPLNKAARGRGASDVGIESCEEAGGASGSRQGEGSGRGDGSSGAVRSIHGELHGSQ